MINERKLRRFRDSGFDDFQWLITLQRLRMIIVYGKIIFSFQKYIKNLENLKCTSYATMIYFKGKNNLKMQKT